MFACNPAGCCSQGLFFLHPAGAVNISTRLDVGTGDNVLIGGFITQGNAPAKLVVRGIGPSLSVYGPLSNPYLELHNSSATIASNDDWKVNLAGGSQEAAIEDTTLAPTNDLESAIVATLPANNSVYTAIVRGANNETGLGMVEAYDLDQAADAKLANISTRGLVQTGDNVMIGGFIIVGAGTQRVIVRAIGPSLPVPGALADPTLDGQAQPEAAGGVQRDDLEHRGCRNKGKGGFCGAGSSRQTPSRPCTEPIAAVGRPDPDVRVQ